MANAVILGSQRLDISDGYVGYYPCLQENTDTTLADRSGQSNTGTLGTLSTAEAWANANCATTLASANKHITIANADIAEKWTLASDTVFLHFMGYATLPVSTLAWVGNTASTAGFKMSLTSGGAPSINYYGGTSVFGSAGATTLSGATWYHISIFIDGVGKTSNFWINGTKQLSSDTDITNASGIAGSATAFIFGASLAGDSGIASRFANIHMLVRPSSLGRYAYAEELHGRLYRSPFTPVSKSEWGV